MVRRIVLLAGVILVVPAQGHGEDIAGEIESLCASISSGGVQECIEEQNTALIKLQEVMNGINTEASGENVEDSTMLDSTSIMNCISTWTTDHGLINYRAAIKCLEKPPAYTL